MPKQSKQSIAESVRKAVERTFQSTMGSAAVGRERAQELVDEVVRRSEEGARSAGELGGRIREAIQDLRLATGDDVKRLQKELEALKRRVAKVERDLKSRQSGARSGNKPR